MATPEADPVEVARRLASRLEQEGVPYAIGGALAYGYWGAARATQDVDLNVFLPPERLEPALVALRDAGLSIDPKEATRSAEERGDAVGWSR